MSNEILEAVREHGEKFDRELKSLDGKLESALNEMAQKMVTADGDGRGDRGNKGNPLAMLAKDAGIKSVAEGRSRNAMVKMDGSIHMLTKSLLVGDVENSNEDLFNVQANRASFIGNDPRRRLSLLDYLPRQKVTSNSFEFNKLSGYTNAADYQATEGALKPESAMPTDLVSVSIATIAAWIPASKQVLADVPGLQRYIGNLLAFGVRRKLESELIVGAGGTGVVSGLLDPGNFTAHTAASGDSLADAVSKAKAVMDAAGWNPGLVIAHPTDWEVLCRERESGGAGAYVAGSWRDPTPPSIWGVPVITNAAVTAGSFIILDPSQVLVLDREDTTIEVGYADDDFVRNRIRILAEMRAGLAVLSPGAVIAGDFEP